MIIVDGRGVSYVSRKPTPSIGTVKGATDKVMYIIAELFYGKGK